MENKQFDSIWDALYPDSIACASSLELKSILMKEITDLVRERGWETDEAASRLDLKEDVLNHILAGQIDQITIDDLLLIMEKAGRPMEIILKRAA